MFINKIWQRNSSSKPEKPIDKNSYNEVLKTTLFKTSSNKDAEIKRAEFIKYINSPDNTNLEKLIFRMKNPNPAAIVFIIFAIVLFFQSELFEDFWRWIKVGGFSQEDERPTLLTDPIVVFNNSMLKYTGDNLSMLSSNEMQPVKFTSITRYKDNSEDFIAEFHVADRPDDKCKYVVKGRLDDKFGGITNNQFTVSIDCLNTVRDTPYKLIALKSESMVHHVNFMIVKA